MAGDHIADRGTQRIHVELAADPQHHRDVVHAGVRIESVDEPHALLRERQWDRRGPGIDPVHWRRRGCTIGDDRHQFTNAGGVEDVADVDGHAELVRDPRRDSGRGETGAAEIEERFGDARAIEAQQVCEDLRDNCLFRCRRRDVLGRLKVRCRQRAPIDLARTAERHVRQRHPGGGTHVLGQPRRHAGRHRFEIDVVRCKVADELLPTAGCVDDSRCRVHDAGSRCDRGLHFAQLESLTTELDLEVSAPQVLDGAVGVPSHQVARAVQPLSGRPERVCDEPFRREVATCGITASELDTAQVELAWHADRDQAQGGVEHVSLRRGNRNTDRDGHIVDGHSLRRDIDCRFGGTVQVLDLQLRECAEDRRGDRRSERFTRGEQDTEASQVAEPVAENVGERGQHRWHEVHDRHGLARDEVGHVCGVSMSPWFGDDEGRTERDGQKEFPHRHVEGDGRLLHEDVVSAQHIPIAHPLEPIHHGLMRDGHAFRQSGGTGGEQGVGGGGRRDLDSPNRYRRHGGGIHDPGTVDTLDRGESAIPLRSRFGVLCNQNQFDTGGLCHVPRALVR